MDTTYAGVNFSYETADGKSKRVRTLEGTEYPQHYRTDSSAPEPEEYEEVVPEPTATPKKTEPEAGHRSFMENQRGVTYESLFAEHIKGSRQITITDPYIRIFYQIRNLMEFMKLVIRLNPEGEETKVHLITVKDDFKAYQQEESFQKIQETCAAAGVQFSWKYDETGTIHARHIVTDTEWKILLDRGLDIFQHYEMNDAFALANRLQQHRSCKAFEITYVI